MTRIGRLRRGWILALLVIATAGCAADYHAYPCSAIPYGYCPPPPLPHAAYTACPTPIATCFGTDQAARGAFPAPTPADERHRPRAEREAGPPLPILR